MYYAWNPHIYSLHFHVSPVVLQSYRAPQFWFTPAVVVRFANDGTQKEKLTPGMM